MASQGTERRLAAILSADVVGYSRLMAEDEAGTIRTVTAYREEVELLVRQHRGRLVDSTGDNFLAEFPTALDAVRGAIQIQRVLKVRNSELPTERRMEFRIGIHMGDIAAEGERIYGNGVNIAARLESLAEPGGICISGTVYEQVESKLDLRCDDLGEQSVKNIPRPVHVYRVKLGVPDTPSEAESKRAVPDIFTRPAIAVLPFDNLSGDREQEYFADGIAEDLITQLSLCRSFPVIARNSSFLYKGRAVDVREVSRELGARYVVEGSVRKAGDRVRVSAQLIDAASGQHIWAERYDRELHDIFALQDELTTSIAAAIHPEIEQAELSRVRLREPTSLSAWEAVIRGRWHLYSVDKDLARARAFFEEAIEIDPYAVAGFHGLAVTHYNDLVDESAEDPERSVAEIVRASERCIALDDQNALSHLALAIAHSVTERPREMIEAAESAIELNPSESRAHLFLGMALNMNARYDEAIARFEQGTPLNPRENWIFCHNIALSHFGAERYELAADWARRSLQHRAEGILAWRFLAASLGQLDRLDEARAALREALRLSPRRSRKAASGSLRPLSAADPRLVERFVEGLRKARPKE